MSKPNLSPERFDAILSRVCRATPRVIWTAVAIAHRIGTSPDFVRDKLATLPGTPVKQIGGRYCAVEADLITFFRSSDA